MSRALLGESSWVTAGPWADAYGRAIGAVVRPGDIVVDLSAGVGVHAVQACRAGAARVYAVERDPSLLALVPAIAAENGFERLIVASSALPVSIGAGATVVVTRVPALRHVGRFVDGLAEARTAFPRAGLRFVPERLSLMCAPVEAGPWYQRHIDRWSAPRFDLSFLGGRRVAANTVWDASVDVDACLAPPAPAGVIAPATCEPARLVADLRFTVDRPGTLHAVAGWLEATLAEHITVSQRLAGRSDASAPPCLFPIDPPVAVEAGSIVDASLRMDVGAEPLWTWRVRVTANDVERADRRHSMFQGLLLDLEGAAKGRPDFTPTLSSRGRAELDRLRRAR